MARNSNWFLSIEKKPIAKPPAFSKTLQIDKIAPGSPAEDLTLRPGDKLLSVNGKAALTTDIPELLASQDAVQYRFFLSNENSFLEVATTGLPLGIVTSASSDGIVDQYAAATTLEAEGLLKLWERGDYERIKQIVKSVDKRLNRMNVLGKLTGKRKTYSATTLMSAACEFEAGNAAAGKAGLEDYTLKHLHSETSDVNAVMSYYCGMEMKSQGNNEAYQSHIEEAYSSYPESARIRDEALHAGVEVDRPDPRVGTSVASDTPLTYLEGGQGVTSLRNLLAGLAPGKILPLCLMPTYRGNGPYNEALLPYIALYPFIKDKLHPLVVLTNVTAKRKDRPYWFSHEVLAKKQDVPLLVLHDPAAEFMEDFTPTGAPEFFALDQSGKIIWSGGLGEDYEYWDMMSQLSNPARR